jgi:signal transduction histidine kinase
MSVGYTAPDEWKVVLIDDEEDIREVMSITLGDSGYRVSTASDGTAGVRLCETIEPQIVITDVRMPGLNGIQVLEQIKKKHSDTEVIVTTAFGDLELAIRALRLDASDFITKPVNDEVLHLALKRAKERYAARKQIQDYTRLLEREVADQARVLHQGKMMALGKLAASVAHEINNPLSGVLNYLRLMKRIMTRGEPGREQLEKFHRYLEIVEKETARCSEIVSSLLAFSRKSPPSLGEVRVDDLLNRCILLSRHKLELSRIELACLIDPHVPPIQGDFNQLQQAVINLIFNAIDAMPDGGTMQLSSGFERDTVSIAVEDTGSGISEADLPHLFEPFYTTKKEGHGVGLGLSTVYGIMERHKGSVSVENLPETGARFTLRLPAPRCLEKEI